jgi:hypothetical protein
MMGKTHFPGGLYSGSPTGQPPSLIIIPPPPPQGQPLIVASGGHVWSYWGTIADATRALKKSSTSILSPPPPRDNPVIVSSGQQEPILSVRQQEVLYALLALGATCSDKRCTARKVAREVIPQTANVHDEKDKIRKAIAGLRDVGFVQTAYGHDGGSWLTPTGEARARRLSM